MKYTLDQSTREKLGYYVYLLIDPRNNRVFYVGKGKGTRIYNHLVDAEFSKIKEYIGNKKLDTIKSIKKDKEEVILEILRHGMTEDQAFEVEAAMTDYFGLQELTGLVKGHHSNERGKMSLKDIKILYEAEEANISEPALLIKINNTFTYDMSEDDLYEATRKSWRISLENAKEAKLIFSVYKGIIRGIYQDCIWSEIKNGKDKGKKIFTGRVAEQKYLDKYLFKSVNLFQERGAMAPIRYLNIE